MSGGLSTHVALISLIIATHRWAAHSRVSTATQTVWRASLHTPSITCAKHNDRHDDKYSPSHVRREGRSTHRYSFSNLREEDSRECHIKINHKFELFIVIHYNDHSIKDSNNSQLLRYFNHTINSPPSHFATWIFNIHFSFSLSLFFFIT